MKRGSLRKHGWVWTKHGWKKAPQRLRRVKRVPLPSKKQTKKIRRIAPPEARQIVQEQGRAVAAPTPQPQAAKPTPRPPRRAWHGKYADLAKQED